MMLEPVLEKRKRVLLVTAPEPVTAPAIKVLHECGFDIVGVLYSPKSRTPLRRSKRRKLFAPRWSHHAMLDDYGPPETMRWVKSDIEWDDVWTSIEATKPDLLVSAYFGTKVPLDFLNRFPLGGVNFHPALLPMYAGPLPNHGQMQDGSYEATGGMTTHIMDENFDTGPIISQVPIRAAAWSNENRLTQFQAGALCHQIREGLVPWVRGEIQPTPQPAGGSWSSMKNARLRVKASWSYKHLRDVLGVFSTTVFLDPEDYGRGVKLFDHVKQLSQPTGDPLKQSEGRIEFDLGDARVLSYKPTSLQRKLKRFRDVRKLMTMHPVYPDSKT